MGKSESVVGIQWVNKDIVLKSFSSWTGVEKFNMFKKGNIWIVWMEVVWNIWKIINAILFEGSLCIISDMF